MRNHMTQMEAAKKGIVTSQMQTVVRKENMDTDKLLALVACGQVVIPANIQHKALSAEGIGTGLRTKVNVNLGISGDCRDYGVEIRKAQMAHELGA